MKRSINHKRYSGYPEELSLLKGFKVVGVGCGDIEKEGATSIMLMNDHNVAVDLNPATAKKHRVTTTQQTTQSISLVQQALLQAIMLPTVTP